MFGSRKFEENARQRKGKVEEKKMKESKIIIKSDILFFNISKFLSDFIYLILLEIFHYKKISFLIHFFSFPSTSRKLNTTLWFS